MSQKVLVTGGAGYIGSTLVPMLLDEGYTVSVVDNFLYRENSLAHVCHHPRFSVASGDIRDERVMREHLKDADVIVPLAAIVGAPACDRDPVAAATVNRDAAIALFRAASPTQRILMPTTNSGYGTGAAGVTLTEETPLKPLSLYARHKVEVEAELMARENATSFRLATVFGMSPRMRLDLLVNDFTYRAVHDRFVVLFEGGFRRNYIHVRDVAGAFLFGLKEWDKVRGQAFNVGLSEANLSKRELCARIAKAVPGFVFIDAPVGEDPDKRDYLVSNEKIERAGFKPRHTLEMGIEELVKGYRMLRNGRYGNG